MKCARAGGVVILALLLFVGGGIWNATRAPVVHHVRISLEGLPPGREVRVLHITDTHGGYPDMPRFRIERIVDQANALQPDLILLTGDYHSGKLIDKPEMRLEDALEPLARLRAPMGVYAAMGNHDRMKWTPLLMKRHVWPVLLIDENVDLGLFTLVGINSVRFPRDPGKAFANVAPDKPVLVIFHEPKQLAFASMPDRLADDPESALALAGHTHGGQILLPLIGPARGLFFDEDAECLRGLCTIEGRRIFVSSGIGTTALPMRYGVPPEMVMITLYSTGRNSGTER